MFKFISTGVILFLAACNHQSDNSNRLQQQIDSLKNKLNKTYKPGLGEFMTEIQLHHAKLWFAGKNANWELANFEMGEIRESIDAIQQYCTDRPEIRELPLINPPLDSLKMAITGRNKILFNSSFILLTNTCNNCHQVTKHGFNIIRIPDTPPVTNQVF